MLSRLFGMTSVLATLVLCGVGASAAPVSITNVDTVNLPTLPTFDIGAPTFGGGTFDNVTTGGGVPGAPGCCYRSPFQEVNETYTSLAYEQAPYRSIFNGSGGYNFTSGKTGLNILWGSPDGYNTLEFFSGKDGGGASLGSFSLGDLLPWGATAGRGHDMVTFISTVAFLSIVLTSGSPAFEYAALTATGPDNQTNLPLPPAILLFGSALAGLTVLGRRRRQGAAAA
jgi:hypothetical protein